MGMQEKPADLVRACSESLKQQPGNAQLLRARASAYSKLGELEAAVADYTAIINGAREADAGIYFLRGLAYEKLERAEDALRDYNTVLRREPSHASAMFRRANLVSCMGHVSGAMELYEQAIQQDATNKATPSVPARSASRNALSSALRSGIQVEGHTSSRSSSRISARSSSRPGSRELSRKSSQASLGLGSDQDLLPPVTPSERLRAATPGSHFPLPPVGMPGEATPSFSAESKSWGRGAAGYPEDEREASLSSQFSGSGFSKYSSVSTGLFLVQFRPHRAQKPLFQPQKSLEEEIRESTQTMVTMMAREAVRAQLQQVCAGAVPGEPAGGVERGGVAAERGVYSREAAGPLAVPTRVSPVSQPADRLLRLRNEALQRKHAGDYVSAVSLYTDILELEPTSHDVYSGRAGCYLALDNKKAALRDYESALKCLQASAGRRGSGDQGRLSGQGSATPSPENACLQAGVLCSIASVRSALGEHKAALELLGRGLGLLAGQAGNSASLAMQLLLARAACKKQTGDLPGAISDCTDVLSKPCCEVSGEFLQAQGLQAGPVQSHLLAHMTRAQCNGQLGNRIEAVRDYTQAIERDSGIAALYHNRGTLYDQQGRADDALSDYSRSIELNPSAAESYNCRGLLYSSRKQYAQALDDFTSAISLRGKENYVYWANRADVSKDKGDYDKALADYETALRLNPTSRSCQDGRGYCLRKKGEYRKAIEVYTGMLSQLLSDAGYSNLVERVFPAICSPGSPAAKQEPLDTTALKMSAESFGRLDKILINRGYCLAKAGEISQAILDYGAVVQHDGSNLHAIYNRGILFDRQGKFEDAIRDFSQVISLNPADPQAYFSRGSSYDSLGLYDEAMRDYSVALLKESRNAKPPKPRPQR